MNRNVRAAVREVDARFARRGHDLRTREGAFDQCYDVAQALRIALRRRKVPASVYKCEGLERPLRQPAAKYGNAKWQQWAPKVMTHWVVRVEDTVLDLTAPQFGKAYGRRTVAWKTLLEKWGSVYPPCDCAKCLAPKHRAEEARFAAQERATSEMKT